MLDMNQEFWGSNENYYGYMGNIKLLKMEKRKVLEELRHCFLTQKKARVFFLDAYGFNLAQINPHYLRNMNAAEFVLNDGVGIRLAARAFNITLEEDFNNKEFISEVLEIINEEKMSLSLLGADIKVTEQTVELITVEYPDINISGIHEGNFTDPIKLLYNINQEKPDLLLVGLGTAIQEGWISHYFDELDTTIIMAVGRHLDPNAPGITATPSSRSKLPVKWSHRYISEWKKIFRKYIVENGIFFSNIMKLARKRQSEQREL
ncbi:WecB/TagA/CpsF family glycosyltransferase [Planococcus beigongshangi]|uniref:WecB/TagA/CpsF family glycosyltransferase n=1 Tax=Planococcus beigongshangi TaxID=2782536 RepID=UPI00193B3DC4|nr:WecB/TagA/CpsF family glycosyltransferase [Planococcus beigongshangi]